MMNLHYPGSYPIVVPTVYLISLSPQGLSLVQTLIRLLVSIHSKLIVEQARYTHGSAIPALVRHRRQLDTI